AGRARHHPRRPPEPQGDRHRGTRRASGRDRAAGATRAGGGVWHEGVPRALRARRAGLGEGSAPPGGARPLMASAPEARPAARGLPVVAIVGRPNVGKSTLFNRLVGARRAIVDDAPGVTRDRVVAPAAHAGRAFLCVDTGGFTAEPPRDRAALAARVREQTLAAVAEADCVVCVLDGAAGPAAEDARGTRLALIGRPNVGKSSLLNRLLGAERTIVAPEPGTTRDAIDTPLIVAGRPYVLIDTAGIRRRGKVREPLERHGA